MPKIIENLQRSILREAHEILLRDGAENLTVSVLAQRCGIAVGTIYNYYPSKDRLIAEVIAADWEKALFLLDGFLAQCAGLPEALQTLYSFASIFSRRYRTVFLNENLPKISGLFLREKQLEVRGQLAGRLGAQRMRFGCEADPSLDIFLAQAILTWAPHEPDYSRLEPYFLRLLR